MERDGIVWFGSILLFCSGIVFSKFIPTINPSISFGGSEIIALVSAIATAIAAFAAWKAADTARSASQESSLLITAQLSRFHAEQFEKILNEMERDMSVMFLRRSQMYDNLFPIEERYSEVNQPSGNRAIIKQWLDDMVMVQDITNDASPTKSIFELWMVNTGSLVNNINFRLCESSTKQVWINGRAVGIYTDDAFAINARIYSIVSRLCLFCKYDLDVAVVRPSDAFMKGFKEYFANIASGKTAHVFR